MEANVTVGVMRDTLEHTTVTCGVVVAVVRHNENTERHPLYEHLREDRLSTRGTNDASKSGYHYSAMGLEVAYCRHGPGGNNGKHVILACLNIQVSTTTSTNEVCYGTVTNT